MDKFQTVTGQCQCGSIRFQINGPASEMYHCHCQVCRRLHGSLFGTFAVIRREDLWLEQGQENLSAYNSKSNYQWHFCKQCGCHIYVDNDAIPDTVFYRPSLLDAGQHPGHPAQTEKHIFVGSKSSLEHIADDLPQFEEFSPQQTFTSS